MGKKENKRKSNLKLSLLLLLLAAILLISSLMQWFTSNQTVTVSSLNVNVEQKMVYKFQQMQQTGNL